MEIHNENDLASEENVNSNSEQKKIAKIKADLEKLQVWNCASVKLSDNCNVNVTGTRK